MKLKYVKKFLMDTNEGSVSVESAIVLPVIILILMSFIYLMIYIRINDDISKVITNNLISNQIDEYKKSYGISFLDEISFNSKTLSKINESIDVKDKMRISNLNVATKYYEGKIIQKVTYNFKSPFKIVNDGIIKTEIKKEIRVLGEGDSILDYTLISDTINTSEDLWSLSNYERAKRVSNILGGTTSFDGSTIDKIEDGKYISIVSLDFRKKSYDEIGDIVNKLRHDIEKLKNYKIDEASVGMIGEKEFKNKMLHLVVPDDKLEDYVEIELLRIKNFCNNNDIEFKVTALKGG